VVYPCGAAVGGGVVVLARVLKFPMRDQSVLGACVLGLLLIGMTACTVALRIPDEASPASVTAVDSLLTSAPSPR
jgi:hypothetical protein